MKVTPLGSAPVCVIEVVVGVAVVVTVKLPAVPATNDVAVADVKVGGKPRLSVNVWVAGAPKPLVAVTVQT